MVSDAARVLNQEEAKCNSVADGTVLAAAQLLLTASEESSGEKGTSVGAGADVRRMVEKLVAGEVGRGKNAEEVYLQVQQVAKHVGSRICTPRDMVICTMNFSKVRIVLRLRHRLKRTLTFVHFSQGALPALRLRQALTALYRAADPSYTPSADEQAHQESGEGELWDSCIENQTKAFVAPPNGKGRAGLALDIEKLTIKWKAGERGAKIQKGGFGYVYFGVYDASSFAGPAQKNVQVVVKLPTDDEDAVRAFEREGQINERIASFGGMRGVAEYLGYVDVSGVEESSLPAGVGGKKALVWRQVMGKTLDTYFDRRGGMSPMLAKTLEVRASAPVKLPTGDLSYIKTDLATKVMGHALLTLIEMHEKQIIHRDLKPQNLMLVESDIEQPFRLIDMGSALLKGQTPLMDDYTEIYAPPEAPDPDKLRPDAYDVYTIGIIGLRCLMPALLAGEAGVQTLGKVTCSELPASDHDFRKW